LLSKGFTFAAFSSFPLWAIKSKSMKRRLAFIVIVSFIAQSLVFGQYIPLVQNNAKWNEFYQFEDLQNYEINISGDSLINGIKYKKVIITPPKYFGSLNLLREDTTLKKVYQYIDYYPTGYEELIYDFSMNVGDTIWIESYPWILVSISDTIPSPCMMGDTITCSLNPKRVFWFESSDIYPIVWIEGIGSISGLFLYNYPWCRDYKILCHFDSNQTWNYHYKAYNETIACQLPVLVANLDINSSIKIYPNPSSSKEIIIQGDHLKMIKVLSNMGIVLNELLLSENKNIVQLSYPQGMYLVEVILNDGTKIIKKVILE